MKKIVGGLILGLTLLMGAAMIVYPASITQLAGLAVAQSATQWNPLKDMAVGDGQTSGVLLNTPCLWNGTSCDRQRGQADNLSNPTSGKIPTLPCVVNAGSPAWTAGNAVPLTCRVTGESIVLITNTNINPSSMVPVEGTTLLNQTATSAANTALTVTLTGAANQRVGLKFVDVFLSAAGTCNLTIQDGATTIYTHPVGAFSAGVPLLLSLGPTGISGSTGNNVVVSVQACGAAITSTVNIVAARQ